MCILKQPFLGLWPFSPQRSGGGSSWCSIRVRRGSWGCLSVCLPDSEAADSAAVEAPCHSAGCRGQPCSPGGCLCARALDRLPSSASLGSQDFLREKSQRGNDVTGSRGGTCPQWLGLRKHQCRLFGPCRLADSVLHCGALRPTRQVAASTGHLFLCGAGSELRA